MRRFTVGCTSDAHQLYQTFLGHQCIFEYSREDLDALMAAKRMEIGITSISSLSDNDVLHHFSKEKLAVPWRRQTRGVEGTTRLIHELLAFDGDQGRDSLGVPLLSSHKVWAMRKHSSPTLHVSRGVAVPPDGELGERKCPSASLQTHQHPLPQSLPHQLCPHTGSLVKGYVRLPAYRHTSTHCPKAFRIS